jgi:CO/xanthine dehydrogenase FAD-binding subunit
MEILQPDTWDEALALKAEHPAARPIAGGTDLMIELNFDRARPPQVLDLTRVGELSGWAPENGRLRVGSGVTYTRLIAELGDRLPGLAIASRTVGSPQIRNRGTVGGNVCVNDPTNHYPPLLSALGASFTIRGAGGERVVSAEDFFLGVYATAVGEGDLLTKISVPTRKPGTGDAMEGIAVGTHGTYIVDAAATVGPDGVRVAIGCVAAVPVSATAMEERLQGGDLSEEAVRAAAQGLGASFDPPSDVHASADYRRHLAEVSAVRAVLKAAERARG